MGVTDRVSRNSGASFEESSGSLRNKLGWETEVNLSDVIFEEIDRPPLPLINSAHACIGHFDIDVPCWWHLSNRAVVVFLTVCQDGSRNVWAISTLAAT